MCGNIYIGHTQQSFKKIMHGHFSDLQRLLRNGQRSDSFASHLVHQFNNTTPHMDICTYMKFKVIMELNRIGMIKTFTKYDFNVCMQARLTILKNICENPSQL